MRVGNPHQLGTRIGMINCCCCREFAAEFVKLKNEFIKHFIFNYN